jgi:peptide/nickel transport system ATP-binding protein
MRTAGSTSVNPATEVDRMLPATESSLLRVSDLRCTIDTPRGRAHLLRGISFHMRKGSTLGIVGESGSGKSVLSLAIMGLLPRSFEVSGEIEFDGVDLSSLPYRQRRQMLGVKMAMVFQDSMTSLNPVMPVGRQIAESLRKRLGHGRREAATEAEQLLREMGIPDPHRKARQYPHELSGGMRQRVSIAAALACSPELLIADEATTALDVTVQKQVLDRLQEIQQHRGMSMVIISHDLAVVASRTDELVVMYGGRAVEAGSTGVVLGDRRHRYTDALISTVIASTHQRGDRVPTIPGAPPTATDEIPGCPFYARCTSPVDECQKATRRVRVGNPAAAVPHVHACLNPLPGRTEESEEA